jgi:hypothetical protein
VVYLVLCNVKLNIMDIREKNKITNIVFRLNFDYMPLLPLIKKVAKPLSGTGGVYDTWYSFSFHWLFLQMKPKWRYEWNSRW